jgi:hypothetical protein
MTTAFTPSATQMEARFLLVGEVFERKSITYTVALKPVTHRTTTVLHVRADYPDGTSRGTSIAVASRLGVDIIGRWV